ncbi:MAG: NAD(P)H-binding protein [Bacteroidetes bacterium]|nr:NAD(P)H-binding protein [Bacteroidota bacterium]
MYVITGASGNTGKRISEALLAAGKKVRVISRDAKHIQDLVNKGAEPRIGSTDDPEFTKAAFAGAQAAYVLVPGDYAAANFHEAQLAHIHAIAAGLRHNNIPYAVTLSSQGAHLPEGSGVVLALYKMERALEDIPGLNILHLRPTYFMENSLGMVGMVKQAGIMGSPIRPDLRFPAIATRDIAEHAIERLLALDFSGHQVQDLLGSRDVSYVEIASTYGKAIGKPELPYVQFTPSDFKQAMLEQMGASESAADHMLEFIACMNAGGITGAAQRNERSTTPTTIEDFANVFSAVYKN